MDKLEALEIVWKILPVEATDLQKEAWKTVKYIVHAQQADTPCCTRCGLPLGLECKNPKCDLSPCV